MFTVLVYMLQGDSLFVCLLYTSSLLLVVMHRYFPPAIPSDSLPVSSDGPRWFLVSGLTADPFAERIVGHYRRPLKDNLEGQVALWEQESKKTV